MPDNSTTILGRLTRLPARLMIGVVRAYQMLVSPVLPVVFGPRCGCRFYPTCSHYAIAALRTHGAAAGGWLALKRLLRCTPLHPGGIDHVPPPSRSGRTTPARPICQRIKSVSTQSLSHG